MNYLLFVKENDKQAIFPFHFYPSKELLDLFTQKCNIIKIFKLNEKNYRYELLIEL